MSNYCPKCHRDIKDRLYCPFCGYDPEMNGYQKPFEDTWVGYTLNLFPLKFTGTMNRKDYALYTIGFSLLTYLAYHLEFIDESLEVFAVILLVSCIVILYSTVRRLRDIHITPWLAIALVIPYVNVVLWVLLLLIPGKKNN